MAISSKELLQQLFMDDMWGRGGNTMDQSWILMGTGVHFQFLVCPQHCFMGECRKFFNNAGNPNRGQKLTEPTPPPGAETLL